MLSQSALDPNDDIIDNEQVGAGESSGGSASFHFGSTLSDNGGYSNNNGRLKASAT